MIVVLVASGLPDATTLFPLEAELLTLEQLAGDPTTLPDPGLGRSELTVGGRRVGVGELTGVVNLVPAVVPELLPFYDEEEREYQASELHALLTFFLSSLTCPVVNRPTALSLSGPAPTPLAWLRLAREAGVPTAPLSLDSRELSFGPAQGDVVVCVGGRVVQPAGTVAEERAARLAATAGVGYLRAWFDDEARLVRASGVPDLRAAATRLALAELLA